MQKSKCKIFFLYFFIFNFSTLICFAQINPETKRANWWFFGEGAGIDWTTGSPVAVNNGQTNSWEGSASISDKNGNLLFYSDGNTIWNKNHVPMAGGFNLLSCNSSSQPIQVMQNALIIPHPGNDSLYYLFHLGCYDFTLYTLRYTVVNMNLNGGLGGVVSPLNALMQTKAQGLAACRHSDGCSVWIVAMDTMNFHNFFKLDITGLNTVPLKQFSDLSGAFPVGFGLNYKFSNDLQMLASVMITGYQYDSLIIHQFNNSNATLSNPIRIFTGDQTVYDVCFSPDNKKIYASGLEGNGASLIDTLWQYDLNIYSESAVLASKTMIYADSMGIGHMQNGPDGKIYMARFSTNFTFSNQDSLAVINNPNVSGLACNFNFNAVYLLGKQNVAGLPNFDQAYFYPSLNNTCATSIDEITISSFKIYPNPFADSFIIENTQGFDFNFSIISVNGDEVYSGFVSSYQNKTVTLAHVPSGIYFLKFNNQTKTISYKILKQ